jgi:hypothetical protein
VTILSERVQGISLDAELVVPDNFNGNCKWAIELKIPNTSLFIEKKYA